MACGAKGVVSVASNLIPEIVSEMVGFALSGDFESARCLHLSNYNLFTDLFCEPNPVPVKILMEMAGFIQSSEVRLPLCSASPSNQILLKALPRISNFHKQFVHEPKYFIEWVGRSNGPCHN